MAGLNITNNTRKFGLFLNSCAKLSNGLETASNQRFSLLFADFYLISSAACIPCGGGCDHVVVCLDTQNEGAAMMSSQLSHRRGGHSTFELHNICEICRLAFFATQFEANENGTRSINRTNLTGAD